MGYKNITGERFGKLVAVQPTDQRRYGSVVWECKCDCGATVWLSCGKLCEGFIQSCGCDKNRVSAGQRFGFLTTVRATSKRQRGSVVWECKCDCGETVFVPRSTLASRKHIACSCCRGKQ